MLTLSEVFDEAFARCQLDARSGYDYRSAKRSLTLLQADWSNKGLNLWTVQVASYPLLIGASQIVLPVSVNDILDAVIRDETLPPMDLGMERASPTDMLNLPFKQMPGRPTRYSVSRAARVAVMSFWPIPNKNMTVTVNQIMSVDPPGLYDSQPMVPDRFMEALISGLAYFLSQKHQPARTPELRAIYMEAYQSAADEDRDRSSMFISPSVGRV